MENSQSIDDIDTIIEELETEFEEVRELTSITGSAPGFSSGSCTNDCTHGCTNSCTGSSCD